MGKMLNEVLWGHVPLISKIKVIHHVKEAQILLTILAQSTAL